MTQRSVLSRRSRPTTKSYRSAVKTIVIGVQAAHALNDGELAERLGCSASTIKNARSEATNLDGVTLANIEYEFGPAALDPFLALGGSRAVPLNVCDDSGAGAAMCLAEVLHRLIAAQSAEGDVSPRQLAAIEPQLRAARQSLDVLIDRATFARGRIMADDVDRAADLADLHRERSMAPARAASAIPAGIAGECEACVEDSPRLVMAHGMMLCARCRDKREVRR